MVNSGRQTTAGPRQLPMTAVSAARTHRAMTVEFKSASRVTPMEHDLIKLVDELFNPTEPQKDTTETHKPVSLDSILPRLPPEGQAWLNGLNPFADRRS